MNEEERREAQLRAMAGDSKPATFVDQGMREQIVDVGRVLAKQNLNALLAHLDETEPAVADAIRYGLERLNANERYAYPDEPPIFAINFPEGHPSR